MEEVGGSLGPKVPTPPPLLPLPSRGEGRTFLMGWLVFQYEIPQQQEEGRKGISFSYVYPIPMACDGDDYRQVGLSYKPSHRGGGSRFLLSSSAFDISDLLTDPWSCSEGKCKEKKALQPR